MSFILQGEVVIDGRKGTTALKDVQREANRTADTFRKAGGSTERLGKSLLSLGLNAGRAGTSLGALGRLGAGGLFGAAVLGSINKFGETVKQASTDYYESQKSLADAFETSFKSTSVEQAQAGLEKTENTIESLRGKITQLGALGGFLEGLEKFSGINLGVGDTKRALDDARNQLAAQEGIVAARIKERDALKGTEDSLKPLEKVSALTKIDIKLAALRGKGKDENVALAEEELKTISTTLLAEEQLLKTLDSITGAKKNQEAIDNTLNTLQDLRVKKAQSEYNLAKATKDQGAKSFGKAHQAGGGVLAATPAGQQAMDIATKRRDRELKKENARTADQLLGTEVDSGSLGKSRVGQQRDREKIAAQQAAANAPSLAEQIQGRQLGIDPAQLAAQNAANKFEEERKSLFGESKANDNMKTAPQKQEFPFASLLKAIEELTKKLPSAVAQ
jgi:hypothetical protein